MDQANPSRLPRLSRLPRPTALPESLQQQPPAKTTTLPRLRSTPSRDHLSGLTPTRYGHSTGPQPVNTLRKTTSNALLKRPSRQGLREPEWVRADSSDEAILEGASGGEESEFPVLSRKHRPSLSERTMETLQRIPSSPVVRKKRDSNFFNVESPMHPASQSSRPGSSYQSDSSMGPPLRSFSSRPSSSAGNDIAVSIDFRASTNTFRPPQLAASTSTPIKRPATDKSQKPPFGTRDNTTATKISNHGTSQGKSMPALPPVKSGSKTLSARQLKPRGSMNGLFRKPSMPALDQSPEVDRVEFSAKGPALSSSSSKSTSTTSGTSKASSKPSVVEQAPFKKSSSALRDQIAKAKAAKRNAASKQSSSNLPSNSDVVPVMPTGTFDFGLTDDPFNLRLSHTGTKGLLKNRIGAARTDGRLNIAAMGFKVIPDEVLNMYNLESIASQGGSWAESVDLTRFIAADNELELLGDEVFPDIDAREAVEEEDAKGNQFGGLETLDLHGNVLIALPRGLRRLELLTTLNLSNNKLDNGAFDIISQISSLRDLNLAGNKLVGSLEESLTRLVKLETLDIQRNLVTALPHGLRELVRLRVLKITENRFTSLPFEILSQLPLIELMAAKNSLSGTLIAENVVELQQLQNLDITCNSLTSISYSEQLLLPALHQLSCSSNRLKNIPNMSSWVSLLNLAAEDNHISAIPDGFVELHKLKTVNMSGNDIKSLDNRIGRMDNLDIFRISGNPLREKKFSSMTTEDLKRALKARIEPTEQTLERNSDDGAFYSAQASPVSPCSPSDWPVRAGVLDRSNTQSHSLNPVAAASVAANNIVKTLELHHNKFNEIPNSIAFFAASLTTLNLAHNEFNGSNFMTDDLDLPVLKDLNLSCNTFNSLQPLIQRLQAPNLERLDISFNRLSSLPPLTSHFPRLWSVIASNNTIKELLPESVTGLRILDVNSNDIGSLNARIGLLGGPGGLERLDVKCNRFRVPNYALLDKGTEAVLAWLRNRLPASEVPAETSPADVD